MRERLGYLARGHIDYGKSALIVSSNAIQMPVGAGTVEKGSFELTNSAGLTAMKGLVRSTDSRVRVWDDRFVSGTVKIRFEVNAQFEEPDSAIEGEFQIISSCGEHSVPFRFDIVNTAADHASGIETPDDLARLAEEDEAAAFSLFTSPGFIHLPFMKNGNYRVLYSGLIGGAGKRAAMEEFLTGIGVKERVHLSVNTGPRSYVMTNGAIADSITVTRSTWGYVSLDVRSDGEFLVPEKTSYTNNDFEGDLLNIRYRVDPKALHAGKNFARLKIDTAEKSFVMDVEVRTQGTADGEEIIARQAYLNYCDLYVNYQLQDGHAHTLLARMQSELTRMRSGAYETSDLVELQHAEIFALQGRTEQAQILLEDAGSRVMDMRNTDVAAYCYYLYVRDLLEPSDSLKELLLQKLLVCSESGGLPDDAVISLLLRMDPVMNGNPSMKLSQMKGWYRMGCRSAFLFMEAAQTAVQNPELIRVLEPFEQYMFDFAVKHGMVTDRLAMKAADMAVRAKDPTGRFLYTLMDLYDQKPSKELIEAICTNLIRGGCRGSEWFRWYRAGVEQDVRITGLYEHFLYSMPDDYREPWPRMVLLYFSYNSVLDEAAGSRLYRYVNDHPDRDPELRERYRTQTERFVLRQLAEGRMNNDLAILYDAYLAPEMIGDELLPRLPEIVFGHSIRCEAPQVTHAVVCYEELRDETVVEFHDGVACAPIYTENARVLTQDARGNRYESFPVTVRPLTRNADLKRWCIAKNPSNEMILLACGSRDGAKDDGAVVYRQKLLHFENLHPAYRRDVFTGLTEWYLEHPDAEGGEDFLLTTDKRFLDPKDRARVIDLMIDKDLLPEAWRLVEKFGPAGIAPEKLKELCSRMVMERLYGYDERVLDMAQICFANDELDDKILEYLCCWYNASSADMYRLQRKAAEAGTDSHDLEERLLGQMLFSGETEHLDEIFLAYIARSSCDEIILKAFLAVKSWLYVMKGEKIDTDIEQYMAQLCDQSDMRALPDICMIALTQSASERVKDLTAEGKDLVERMIRSLWEKGYLFGFYSKFSKVVALPDEFADKAIVEYRGAPGRNLRIVWRLADEEEESADLPEVFEGVYATALPLLYGEELKYDILQASVGDVLTSGTVRFLGKPKAAAVTRTAALNRILAAIAKDDDAAVEDEMMDYAVKDGLVEKCFTPME